MGSGNFPRLNTQLLSLVLQRRDQERAEEQKQGELEARKLQSEQAQVVKLLGQGVPLRATGSLEDLDQHFQDEKRTKKAEEKAEQAERTATEAKDAASGSES